jgi:hypothetical protein
MTFLTTIMRSMLIAVWLTAGFGAWVNCATASVPDGVIDAALSHERGDHAPGEHCAVECLSKASANASARSSSQQWDDHDVPVGPVVVFQLSDAPMLAMAESMFWQPPRTADAAIRDLATVRLLI